MPNDCENGVGAVLLSVSGGLLNQPFIIIAHPHKAASALVVNFD